MSAGSENFSPDGSHWSEREVDLGAFKDARLGHRFAELLRCLSDRMGGTIPLACQDWASTKAAYRFFSNPRVEEGDILSGHFDATRTRCSATEGTVLLLQDTTELIYQRRNPHDVGFTKSVNSGRDNKGRLRHHAVCGILMHSSLAVTTDGLPLGLAHAALGIRSRRSDLDDSQDKADDEGPKSPDMGEDLSDVVSAGAEQGEDGITNPALEGASIVFVGSDAVTAPRRHLCAICGRPPPRKNSLMILIGSLAFICPACWCART